MVPKYTISRQDSATTLEHVEVSSINVLITQIVINHFNISKNYFHLSFCLGKQVKACLLKILCSRTANTFETKR